MLRFKNPLSVSVAPHVWTSPDGKRRIQWRSDTTLFGNFYSQVKAYCEANDIVVPSYAEVEDLMCQQSPRRDCTGDATFHQDPSRRAVANTPTKGCKSCGGRR